MNDHCHSSPRHPRRAGSATRLTQPPFAASSAGLVFVTAFPSRALMARYVVEIAWETEVWVADATTHLIHFNGSRFLGPYR